MSQNSQVTTAPRTLGFFGATGIGVGAMIGGGILALAGVAFSVSGPSAMLAFLLNGVIALITALSFAEMATANPQNGGTYTYAKKALNVQVAFGVGWVVWFASIVAAVLYALGFASFAVFAVDQLPLFGQDISMGDHRSIILMFSIASLIFYTWKLTRKNAGGGMVANIGKLTLFAVLIAGGLAVMVQTPVQHLREGISPFFAGGFSGLLAAMGYTFIALQGFDLIASTAGEVKSPEKTLPKAMITTLVVGLGIYIPLLFVVSTVGLQPGESIVEVSTAYPETVIAIAAQNYLGAFGFWFVMIAGIFSMLSAMQANIFAASRVALSMANDRTLIHHLSVIDSKHGTPINAILATSGIILLLILILPSVAAAGAASSLIFLITFALAHLIMILMRKRGFSSPKTFRVPFYPALPIIGFTACLGLALFQAIAVPAAGLISLIWLLIGAVLFITFLLQRAKAIDASEEALNPDITRLRGLSPLVLMPIANPANAESMVFVANAIAPPVVGRVLLLSIVIPSEDGEDLKKRLTYNRDAIHQALSASFASNLRPDALTTIANEPWEEIARVTKVHQCRSVLLGLSSFSELKTTQNLEKLVKQVRCDVVVFRQPFSGGKIETAKKVLIPVTGFGSHDSLRARVAASLWRNFQPEFTFLHILKPGTPESELQKKKEALSRFSGRIIPGKPNVVVITSEDVSDEIVRYTDQHDLVIMGLGKPGPDGKAFGSIPLRMAEDTETALIFISNK